jgi:hypothetical protein
VRAKNENQSPTSWFAGRHLTWENRFVVFVTSWFKLFSSDLCGLGASAVAFAGLTASGSVASFDRF